MAIVSRDPQCDAVGPAEAGLSERVYTSTPTGVRGRRNRTWTVYSPPLPDESTSVVLNFSNICVRSVSSAPHSTCGVTHVTRVADAASDVQGRVRQLWE